MLLKALDKNQRMVFRPAKITPRDDADLRKVFLFLKIKPDYLQWAKDHQYAESVRVRTSSRDPVYGGYIFDFMKLRRRRYFVFNQYAWVIQVFNKNARPDYGWYYLRGRSALDFLWLEDTAETLRGLVEHELRAYASAGDALVVIGQTNLWLQLNGWGYVFCFLTAVSLFLIIR